MIIALALQAATVFASPIVCVSIVSLLLRRKITPTQGTDDAMIALDARELSDFLETELTRRADEDDFLLARELLEVRDFDDLVELEARTVRQGSAPSRRKSPRGQGAARKRVSPWQKQFRNRAVPRSRTQASLRRGQARRGPQGSFRAARSRSATGIRGPGARPRTYYPRVGRPVGARPPANLFQRPPPVTQGAGSHQITYNSRPNQWHLLSGYVGRVPRPLPPIPVTPPAPVVEH